jgi:hypothetical protein
MLYDWTIEDFIKERKNLETLMNNENNLRKKLYLQKIMDATDKLFHNSFNTVVPSLPSIKHCLIGVADSRLLYGRYYDLINNFMNICEKFYEEIDSIEEKLRERTIDDELDFVKTSAFYTQSRTLSLVDRFYTKFDTELYHYFSIAYADRYKYLRFVDSNDFGTENSNGNTMFIGGVNKNFITISDINPCVNYNCLIHEYGHAIQNLINPDVSYTYREDFFAEVPAIFPELVAMYEHNNKFEPIQFLHLLFSTLVTYIGEADSLSVHTPIINTWADNSYKINESFYSALDVNLDIKKKDLKEILSVNIEDTGVYIISYIASIELLHIYKKDKQKALRIFKNFLNIPSTEDPIYFISENLDLNSSLEEETGEMLKKFKKVL